MIKLPPLAPACALAFALSGCIIVEDAPDGGISPQLDVGIPCPPGNTNPDCFGGDGGGGGGGGIVDGGGGGGGGIGDGGGGTIVVDAGVPIGFPGSGKNGDHGTSLLWLVRVDRGSANLADGEERLVQQTSAALNSAGLAVTAVVAVSMYDGHLIWSVQGRFAETPGGLADALRREAQIAPAAPQVVCPATTLQRLALSRMSSGNRSLLFEPRPGALFIGALDHGARPLGYSDCDASALQSDPQSWQSFFEGPLPRAQTRFALVATPEQLPADQMRQRCLAVAGFPPGVLDVLQPSPLTYFDPLASNLLSAQRGLASRADLCSALGSDWPSIAAQFAQEWVTLLSRLP